MAVAIAVILLLRSQRVSRARKREKSETAGHRRESLLEELDAARSLMIEGHIGAYLEKLWALADSDALRPHADRIDDLHDLKENAKFGGLIPSPDQLNWAEKLVRSAIQEAFPVGEEEEEWE